MLREYSWTDSRITLNFTHPYWSSPTNGTRYYIRLDGKFAEKCIWMPQVQYLNARKMMLYSPSPTAIDNSAMDVYLTKENEILVSFLNLQLTLFCKMDFHNFPFDKQVRKCYYQNNIYSFNYNI